MTTRGQGIGAGAGALLGGILGTIIPGVGTLIGAYVGASIGMMVGSAVDPPRVQYGISQYKKQDIFFNTTAHNVPVPVVYGVNRVAGNILWLGNVYVTVEEGAGGEGGKGKKGPSGPQEIVVHGDFAMGISEGQIAGVTEVWIGEERYAETEGLTYTVYLGTPTQTADDRLVTDLGALAPAFRHTAYLAMGGELGGSPNLPYVNVEAVGKFTTPYSWGNPALIIKDFLSQNRYACGIDLSRFDDASFTEAYSYCVAMIPTGVPASPTEQRFTLDYVADQQTQAVEHLRDMLASFRGFVTWSQGLVKLRVEQPTSCTQSFGMGEIVDGSFIWKRQSYRERANVVRVEYVEPGYFVPPQPGGAPPPGWIPPEDAGQQITGSLNDYKYEYKVYKRDFVEASDPWDIDRTGERRTVTYNLTGIKRRTQAQRMAYYYLNKAIYCSNACAFKVGIGGLQAEVGDVIAVTHDIPKWMGKLFRIAEVVEAEDDTLLLGCLEYNDAVYNDALAIAPHGQDTLYGTGNAAAGTHQVGRLTAYELPNENSLEISYTRMVEDDLFIGTDLYMRRGAGDWRFEEFMLSTAPTAYLTPSIQSLMLTTPGATEDGIITLRGVPGGYSARLMRFVSATWDNTLFAQGVASMGTIVLSSDCTSGYGYIDLYSDGDAYATLAPGNWPRANSATNNVSFHSGDIFDYQRVPQTLTATQTWAGIERAYGGWTNGLSLRIGTEELGFTTFTDSRLNGLTRGANGTTATSHTGVCSIGMVAIDSGGDALLDLTGAFVTPTSVIEFLTGNSQTLYVGASSKFSCLYLWLARKASDPIALAGDYSTGAGQWTSCANSMLIPITDSSSGLRWDGRIAFEPPGNWVPTYEVTQGGKIIGDATARYYLRLTRIASYVVTPPAILEALLTNDQPITARPINAYRYDYVLADSGASLQFKAVARSMAGGGAEAVSAPVYTHLNL